MHIYIDSFSRSNLPLLSMFVILKNSLMWNKVFGFHIGNLHLDSLKSGVGLFIHLRVNWCHIWAGIPVRRIATWTANMTTPMKAVNQEVCALQVNWLAVEDVLVQLTAVVVDDGSWRLFKTGQKDFKRMLWGLVRSHYFKPIANCMRTVQCEDTWR